MSAMRSLFTAPTFPGDAELELLTAAEIGARDRVDELLRSGVAPSCVDANGHSPLHKASFMGFDYIAELLIDVEPASVHAVDAMQNTPLHAAAFSGHRVLVRTLLVARANVDAADMAGNTPLHRATLEGHADV